MERPKIHRNSLGLLILTVVVLVDVGFLVWYWNRRAAQNESFSPSGLNLPAAPALPGETGSFEPARPPAAPASIPPAFDAHGKPLGSPVRQALGTASPGRKGPEPPKDVQRAVSSFLDMQREGRYRKSDVLREWRRDFLSYPDLQEVNRRYWRDRNAVSFVVSTLRSPNFAKMVKRYAESPDVRGFAQDLLAAPGVMEVGRFILADESVMAAVKDLRLPGLPSVGEMMAMGRAQETPRKQTPRRRP